MAIKGKKLVKLYLDEENYEFLKAHMETKPGSGGISGLVDKYLARCAHSVKSNVDLFGNIQPGKLTWKGVWNLFKLQLRMQKEWEELDENKK
jgi:hypothetical protein